MSEVARNPVLTKSVHLKDPEPLNYPVVKTGYYCVGTFGFSGTEYKAVVEFRNAYGELQAAQIAKLPFYGGLTIVYAVMGMYVAHAYTHTNIELMVRSFWAFLYVQNRHDICKACPFILSTSSS